MEENPEVVEAPELPAEQEQSALEVTAPETPEVKETEKTFTQSELDDILEKRLARERRKLERESQVKAAPIDPATIQTQEEMIEFKAREKAVELVKEQEKAKVYNTFFEREEEAAEKYPDYHTVTRSIPLTDDTLAAAMAAENSTEVLYHLGKNPKEAARIASLPAYAQGLEIGKLSYKISETPKAPQVSKAPPPVTPVGAQGVAVKSPEKMTDAEWAEHRRKVKAQRR